MRLRIGIGCCLIVSLLTFNGAADMSNSPAILDGIVVTASKEKTPFRTGDVQTEETPYFYSIITKEAFEGKMEGVAEVIEKEAGIQIRQSGGLGSFSSVSVRGSSEEQVMIYLDGMLLNDAAGGGVNLSNLSLADVEKIEIYRGMTPINFSKASVGGVVNITTHRTKKEFNAHAVAGYGAFDTKKIAALINHKPNKWNYLLSADYQGSSNNFPILNDNGTEWNPADDREEKRHNAQVDQYSLLTKLGYDVSDTIQLDAQYSFFSKDQGLPNWINSDTANTSLDTERHLASFRLTADQIRSLPVNTAVQFDLFKQKEIYDDRGGHIGLSGNEYHQYDTQRYHAHAFIEWLIPSHILTFIADTQYETYDAKNLLGDQSTDKTYRMTYTIGIQDSMILFGERFIATPAIRYSFQSDTFKETDTSKHSDYVSPQLGVKYRVWDGIWLKSNIGKYYRPPSFFELFGDRGFFYGNEDLKPEKGINFDTGLELHYQNSNADIFNRISMGTTYFHSKVDDLITRVYSHGYGKAVNISHSSIHGVESHVQLDLLSYFKLIGNATWQDTENKSERRDLNGKKLPGRFDVSYFGRMEIYLNPFKIFGEYVVEKDKYYDAANLLKAKDKQEINAGMSWVYHSWLFSFEIKNLKDNRYEDFNGYPLPGRAYYFTVKYDY